MVKDLVILKFSASWCAPCKVLQKNLNGLSKKVESIDIDNDPTLSEKYNIR